MLEHHFNDRNKTLTESRPSLKTETNNHNINNKYRTLVTSIFLEIFKMKLYLVMVMCPQNRMIINYFKEKVSQVKYQNYQIDYSDSDDFQRKMDGGRGKVEQDIHKDVLLT